MTRSQFGISLAMIVLVFCTFSCSTKEKLPSSGKDPRDTTSGATATAADTLGSELIPPEAISNEVVRKEAPGSLTLPTTFGHRTGDLDQMIKERRIRALVMI